MRDIHELSAEDTLELFRTLECPTLAEMNGEYRGEQLRAPGPISSVICTLFTNNPLLFGKWLSKSFRPADESSGRGYNSLTHFGRVTRQGPMRTLIAPSRFDGRPAYQLVYRAFHSICGFVHMVDEVRRLDAGRYLGIGTIGFTDAQRRVPLPFLLSGPIGPYGGDMGRERVGFNVVSDLPTLAGSARWFRGCFRIARRGTASRTGLLHEDRRERPTATVRRRVPDAFQSADFSRFRAGGGIQAGQEPRSRAPEPTTRSSSGAAVRNVAAFLRVEFGWSWTSYRRSSAPIAGSGTIRGDHELIQHRADPARSPPVCRPGGTFSL